MTPHVTCVCLTADRQQYTDRAVKNFLAQTYPNKSLLILDNGSQLYRWPTHAPGVSCVRGRNFQGKTIGTLRNDANGYAEGDIIAHWDSDDYSHPLRLAWQVQKLTTKLTSPEQLEAVGYRTMLFWRKSDQTAWLFQHQTPGYAVGTSLMYWRKTWEANPFSELNIGEDFTWLRDKVGYENCGSVDGFFHDEPAMVAEIHESNTTVQTIPGDSWTRKPEWDERLKELMKL
jgi:glycosyltransferase involved in cell wall biosynthesis